MSKNISSNNKTYCWDPSQLQFAQLTADNRIKVWDTASGNLLQELTLPSHLETTYTSLAWSCATKSRTPSKRKRTQNSDRAKSRATYLACGTAKGKVVVWNVIKGEVLNQFETSATNGVSSVQFSETDARVLYVGTANGSVEIWDFMQPTVLSTTQVGGVVNTVSSSPTGDYYATGSESIKIMDTSSNEAITKLKGHLSSVTLVKFSSDGQYMLSMADDRFINLWNIKSLADKSNNAANKKTKAVNEPHQVFSMDTNPTWVDIKKIQGSDNEYDILAVTESGSVNIWRMTKATTTSSLKPHTRIVTSQADKNTIVSAVFNHQNDGQVLVIRTGAKPTFQFVQYTNESNDMIPEVTLEKIAKQLLIDSVTTQTAAAATTTTQPKEVLGAANMERPGARFAAKDNTIQAKIKAFNIAAEEREDEPKNEQGAAAGNGDFSIALAQALKTSNYVMLNKLLAIRDTRLIEPAVQKLPTQYVLPLLDELLHRFQKKGGNAGKYYFGWLMVVISTHAAYLMSLPNTVEKLSPLYSVMTARVAAYPTLLQLSGRLKLLSNIVQKKEQALHVDQKPLNIFTEGQDLTSKILTQARNEEGSDDEGLLLNGEIQDEEDNDDDEAGSDAGEDQEDASDAEQGEGDDDDFDDEVEAGLGNGNRMDDDDDDD